METIEIAPVEVIENVEPIIEVEPNALTATEKRRASARRYYEKNKDKIKQYYRDSYHAKPKAEGQKRGRKPNPKPEPIVPKVRGRKPTQVEVVVDEAVRAELSAEATALKDQITLARKDLWAKQKQLSQIEARLGVKKCPAKALEDNNNNEVAAEEIAE
jgi:hypothetical protein